MSPRFVLGRENVPCVAEVVNRSLKADCTDFTRGSAEESTAGENSSFIFTVYVKSVPLYSFKLAYVVLHMAVKEFFGSHF